MTQKSTTATKSSDLTPDEGLVRRFAQNLSRHVKPAEKMGLAVSGGPDSLALLLLAAAARPGKIEVATVDHQLRDGSRKEAEDVAALCKKLGVPHEILTVEWDEKPDTGIQRKARDKRYAALGEWLRSRGLKKLVTAHHADDQAETILMRMARGSGVKGMGGMRPVRRAGGDILLVRPLLQFTHAELVGICEAAGLEPAADPSNEDSRFERVRVREMLSQADWLNPVRVARMARNLAQADAALRWVTRQEWDKRVTEKDEVFTFEPSDLPDEIRRRIVRNIVLKLMNEGRDLEVRGRELDALFDRLNRGQRATLRGVLCGGGPVWKFTRAPERKASEKGPAETATA